MTVTRISLANPVAVIVVGNEQKTKQLMVTTGIGSGDQIEVNGDLSMTIGLLSGAMSAYDRDKQSLSWRTEPF